MTSTNSHKYNHSGLRGRLTRKRRLVRSTEIADLVVITPDKFTRYYDGKWERIHDRFWKERALRMWFNMMGNFDYLK